MKCLRALVLVLVPLLGGRSGAAEPLDQWQLRTNPAISNNLNAVTFGDDRFVAVGIKGTIAWSSDGATWLPVASGTTRDLFSVAHGNGVFVAGATGNRFFVSNDGLDWTERTTPSPDSPNWYGLTFGDGQLGASPSCR